MKKWLRKDASAAMFFLVPSGIGFALFYLIPFAMGVYYSFMSHSVDGHFVGLDNYREPARKCFFPQSSFQHVIFQYDQCSTYDHAVIGARDAST